jgi:uncharacterized protein (TIGR02996 family)
MTVWFAYRCHYDLPATRFVKRFKEPTLVEWFRNHCKPSTDYDDAERHVQELLGIQPHGFGYFLTRLGEANVPPPRNNRELQAGFGYWSVEGEWLFQPHAIQGLDDDDEEEMAFYLFDDVFAARYPERVAWLTLEDWRLPADVGTGSFTPIFPTRKLKPRGRWEGSTYLIFLSAGDALELTDLHMEAWRLDGVRLPQLARYLASASEAKREDHQWSREVLDLAEEILGEGADSDPMEKAFLEELRANPLDETHWNIFSDWLEEQGRPTADHWLLQRALDRIGKRPLHRHPIETTPEDTPNLSCWRVEPHVAQLCLHGATVWTRNCFDHWVLFDDLWASAHPDLANSLIRQLDRWDVLSSPRRSRSE